MRELRPIFCPRKNQKKWRSLKEKIGKVKSKIHHGNFSRYEFQAENFLKEMRETPEGQIVNWTEKAKKYHLRINGKFPLNGGQVMAQYAKENAINIASFNSTIRSVQHGKRVRRFKKKVIGNVSVPTPRSGLRLKEEMRRKLSSGEIYIGEKVTPKTCSSNTINKAGELEVSNLQIYGRKIPYLKKLFQMETERQEKLGLLRLKTDSDYEEMSDAEVMENLAWIGIQPKTDDDIRNLLKYYQRTRSVKIWHDHSDLLNRSYISFMASFIYDKANYLTDEEFMTLRHSTKKVCVQSLVETPKLYILGQSPSTDKDQLSYIETRLEDLKECQVSKTTNGIELKNEIRFFSGDGPARQFESGQQR